MILVGLHFWQTFLYWPKVCQNWRIAELIIPVERPWYEFVRIYSGSWAAGNGVVSSLPCIIEYEEMIFMVIVVEFAHNRRGKYSSSFRQLEPGGK